MIVGVFKSRVNPNRAEEFEMFYSKWRLIVGRVLIFILLFSITLLHLNKHYIEPLADYKKQPVI